MGNFASMEMCPFSKLPLHLKMLYSLIIFKTILKLRTHWEAVSNLFWLPRITISKGFVSFYQEFLLKTLVFFIGFFSLKLLKILKSQERTRFSF